METLKTDSSKTQGKLQIFRNSDFGMVRAVDFEGNPMFSGNDVATTLGYRDPLRAIHQHVPPEFMKEVVYEATGRKEIFITEHAVYMLVMKSKLPKAKEFFNWMCVEVAPSIRKYGFYINMAGDVDPKFLHKMAEQIERRNDIIAELTPKAEMYDICLNEDTYVDFKTASDIINVAGLGRTNLLRYLRMKHVICQNSILPYRNYTECGYFKVVKKSESINEITGQIKYAYNKKTLVSQRGIEFIVRMLLKDGYQPRYKLGNKEDWYVASKQRIPLVQASLQKLESDKFLY